MLRRMIMVLVGALTLAAVPVRAQDADEYWTGPLALTPVVTITIGLAIAPGDSGALVGTLDSPDQGSFDIPITDLHKDAERLAFAVPSLGGTYEARWNAANQAWDGTWLQSGQSWPLVLKAGERPERTAASPLPADWQVPSDPAIGAIIDARLAGRTGAGIAVGVIEPGGTRIVTRGDGISADTLFEIGSITKIFTALLLAEAVQRGEVSLDDPVLAHLPPGSAMPGDGGAAITLRQLSQHLSGLPRLPDNMPYGNPDDPYADYTEAMMLEFLRAHVLTRAPGAQFEYSNLGVGLLGYVLARAAGTDYENLVRTRILTPLGMADSGITLTPAQQARFAPGHDMYMRPTSEWRLPALAGAGALRSTAADMLRFLGAVLDPASPIAADVAITLDGWQPAVRGVTALGWLGFAPPQGPVMLHSGGTGGYRSAIAAQPATGRAVMVLTNAAAEPSAEDIALHLIAGTPLAPQAPIPPAPPPVPVREAMALSPAQLDRVTGTYSLAPGVTLAVRREGDGLLAQITGQPAFPIYPSAALEFFYRVVDARLRFTEDAGAVTGGVLLQNGREIPLTRIEQQQGE